VRVSPALLIIILQSDVIVIGAGTSGLAAAHHLRNFGYNVGRA